MACGLRRPRRNSLCLSSAALLGEDAVLRPRPRCRMLRVGFRGHGPNGADCGAEDEIRSSSSVPASGFTEGADELPPRVKGHSRPVTHGCFRHVQEDGKPGGGPFSVSSLRSQPPPPRLGTALSPEEGAQQRRSGPGPQLMGAGEPHDECSGDSDPMRRVSVPGTLL